MFMRKSPFIFQENWSFSCYWHCIEFPPYKCSVEPLSGLPYGLWFKSMNFISYLMMIATKL